MDDRWMARRKVKIISQGNVSRVGRRSERNTRADPNLKKLNKNFFNSKVFKENFLEPVFLF